jgi:FkbM family methyltransferase
MKSANRMQRDGTVARDRKSRSSGVRRKLEERARALLPNLAVRRTVRGVTLALPWGHRLPDYVDAFPEYGQNLIAVASALAAHRRGTLRVVDVGANVGDSALQILHATDCRILCVEGDGHWVKWLRRNVSDEHRISVEPSLLALDNAHPLSPVRAHGTTQFRPTAVAGIGGVTALQIRERHPDFALVDLIKIDTDGYDCALAIGLASAWAASTPVMFFEFDPIMALSLGQSDPWRVFEELSAFGYISGVVWNNFGGLIGYGSLAECASLCALLREPRENREFDYADIAVGGVADDLVLRALG